MTNIYAMTEPGPHPGFISLNEMSNKKLMLMVRSPGEPMASAIELTEQQMWDMATKIAEYQAKKATG